MSRLLKITERIDYFLHQHATNQSTSYQDIPLSGEFSLYRGQSAPDLYGMLDAIYILFIQNKIQTRTDRASRAIWAGRILACQDEEGWFSKLNLRGHPREHATAYAIGALQLLRVEPEEDYLDRLKPLTFLWPILTDRATFLTWIERLGFRPTVRSILSKNLGWHYVWRGSHLGGGIAAIAGMTMHLFDTWWPEQVDIRQWFSWYFEWLDAQANTKTGYWQRAFWNKVYCRPTLIDMGGATHFFWIYEAMARPFPYPEQTLLSTLQLQRQNGLYKDHPFCIDLDGNFCTIRAFLQLPQAKQRFYEQCVHQSIEANFRAIVRTWMEKDLEKIYPDLHGLPGALAGLVECAKLPGFKYDRLLTDWQHPLDHVWWL